MRWNTRSAPVRSTRTVMPGYLASKAARDPLRQRQVDRRVVVDGALFLRGLDQLRRDRLRRRAAAWARSTWAAGANVPAATAADPCRTARLEIFGSLIVVLPLQIRSLGRTAFSRSTGKHAAAFRRQMQPHRRSRRDALGRRRDHADLRAVGDLDHVVAARAQEHLPHHLWPAAMFSVESGLRRPQPDLTCWRTETAASAPAASGSPMQRSVTPATEMWLPSSALPRTTLLMPMKRATNSERGRS